MAPKLRLAARKGLFAIVRLSAHARTPAWAFEGSFHSITRTPGELSIVCSERKVPRGSRCEKGWRRLEVEGPLGFSQTGVLASLSAPLSDAGIPIFVVSTFDTDSLFVRRTDLARAARALRRAGHFVTGAVG